MPSARVVLDSGWKRSGSSVTLKTSADNVGLGTVAVSTIKLDILGEGTSSATKSLRIRDSAGNNLLNMPDDGAFSINPQSTSGNGFTIAGGLAFTGNYFLISSGTAPGIGFKHIRCDSGAEAGVFNVLGNGGVSSRLASSVTTGSP